MQYKTTNTKEYIIKQNKWNIPNKRQINNNTLTIELKHNKKNINNTNNKKIKQQPSTRVTTLNIKMKNVIKYKLDKYKTSSMSNQNEDTILKIRI